MALGALLIAGAGAASLLGATPAYATSTCDSSGSPVSVHYVVPAADPHHVSSLVLSDFPAACDGSAVKLDFYGNGAGDPSQPQSNDTLLSSADSTLDPCTQQTLAHPYVVSSESITLTLCATGGAAGVVDVHDLTLLQLFLAPASGGVAATTTSPPPTSGVSGLSTVTPTTGAGSSLLAFAAAGAALIVLGLLAIAGAAPRRDAE